jgi:hypothetical protein
VAIIIIGLQVKMQVKEDSKLKKNLRAIKGRKT